MRALDIKLMSDLRRIWAQGLAIALVMACGIATIIISVGSYRSLDETRSVFYERYRFGSVFATAVRAPLHLKTGLDALPGVSATSLRIMQPLILNVEGMAEPATGIAVSIPDNGEQPVNRLYLRQGRLPSANRTNEIAVLEGFALAHDLQLGDTFKAIMNGRQQNLQIVATVLSPEFIYSLGPGDMVPDPPRFGVIFMPGRVLRGLYDMEGAFNQISLTTMRNADTNRIIEKVDEALRPYGGTGAYDRSDHISHAFLDAELKQLQGMAKVIPPVFLLISAFLVNMILSRLIALEREQVGLLKAVGYADWAIAWHYIKLVLAISLVGLIIGLVAGLWLGASLTQLYAKFFTFPFLIFHHSADLYLLAGGVSTAAALTGAAKSIYSATRLPPAVAMRPPTPTGYRNLLGSNSFRFALFSQLTNMALRHLVRWPARSAFTILGTSLSVSLLIAALFSFDSIDSMIDSIFFRTERQDAVLSLAQDNSIEAFYNLSRLPGVIRAEPYRSVPVTLRNRYYKKRMSIKGVNDTDFLSRILDLEHQPIRVPESGIILSERAATLLHLRPGNLVEIDFQELNNRTVSVPVVGLAHSFVGIAAYMNANALNQLMRNGERISGVNISIDQAQLGQLYQVVKETPSIAGIALLDISLKRFRETIRQNIVTMTTVYVALAVVIAFGVVYNFARIQLSERARELASLRVFGFTRAEVSSVLLIELGVVVALAQPLGWLLGFLLSLSVVKGFDSDLYRIPLVIHSATFAVSSLIVISTAVVSALIVRRRIDLLDLIKVLKTRE